MSPSKHMLGIVVEKLVTVPVTMLGAVFDLLEKLCSANGMEWYEALKMFLRKENPWIAEVEKPVSGLLKLIKSVELPAIGASRPEKYIKVTSQRMRGIAKVLISGIGEDVYGLIKGRLEPEETATTIRLYELCQCSGIDTILAEVGENIEVGFGRMFQMMKKQGLGQEGVLLVNGDANHFCVYDRDGILCMVSLGWSCGWVITYKPVGSDALWHKGCLRFFSH